MVPGPVIAVFDVGRTNKKLFLFNEQYKIVFEKSVCLPETVDEDGFPCEKLENIRSFVLDSLDEVVMNKAITVRAINFSAHGASFVYLDSDGQPVTPLYSYLKPYPDELKNKFYSTYGGEEDFSRRTASPVLGSLNSGMQLYRIKYGSPAVFDSIKYALHLPQYLSFLISGKPFSDITSIGCHTNLWDFENNSYHPWVIQEGILEKLAPVFPSDQVFPVQYHGNNYLAGIGLHDSSAALVPYMEEFKEPFVLISTGTWCISFNPFNHTELTAEELKHDCLCYLNYNGKPVKASRVFSGFEHEQGLKDIAGYFNTDATRYQKIPFNPEIFNKIKQQASKTTDSPVFSKDDLSVYNNDTEAYHYLIFELVQKQYFSTNLVLNNPGADKIFVDGGFSKNELFMNMLADVFPDHQVYSATLAQATAIGPAMVIHQYWNRGALPEDIIKLKYYSRIL